MVAQSRLAAGLGRAIFRHYSKLKHVARRVGRLAAGSAKSGRNSMARIQLLILIMLSAVAAAAQARPRDYAISIDGLSYTADAAILSFTVSNQGGDALGASEIVISEYQSGRVVTSETLPALAADESRPFELPLPLADLPADNVSIQIQAGIDEFELEGSPIARNNTQLFVIDRADAGLPSGDSDSASGSPPPTQNYDLFIPLLNLGINFRAGGIEVNGRSYSGSDVLIFAEMTLAALFCLWLLSLILRLIFRRPPKFEPWQPPYAVNNWHDPNSALGRRQSWQFHAQSSAISAAGAPDQVTVIKRLLSQDGEILGGWTIKAIRSVQYDIYGRISRTEVVMPRKINRQLNRIIRRAPALDSLALRKALSPVSKRLCKSALAAIEKQNRALPLAMDMRLEGLQGEVRILFELYQYRGDAWQLIDHWEPEMGQIGTRIPEHFTFTLNGQLPGENYKEYKARLRDDMTQLLAGMLHQQQNGGAVDIEPQQPAQPTAPDYVTDPGQPRPSVGDLLASDEETDAR